MSGTVGLGNIAGVGVAVTIGGPGATFGRIVGRVLAAGAAVMILFFGIAGGNMFQANQTFAQLRDVTGGGDGPLGGAGAALIFGLLLAVVVGLVIFGGIRSIGRVTSRLVPTMAIVYLAAYLIVIAVNLPQVPAAVGAILSGVPAQAAQR